MICIIDLIIQGLTKTRKFSSMIFKVKIKIISNHTNSVATWGIKIIILIILVRVLHYKSLLSLELLARRFSPVPMPILWIDNTSIPIVILRPLRNPKELHKKILREDTCQRSKQERDFKLLPAPLLSRIKIKDQYQLDQESQQWRTPNASLPQATPMETVCWPKDQSRINTTPIEECVNLGLLICEATKPSKRMRTKTQPLTGKWSHTLLFHKKRLFQ